MGILHCNYEVFNSSVVSSDNCYVIDERGNKYIDFEAGVWCTSLGHNNKSLNRVIIDQLNSISHTGYRYTNKIVLEAAKSVLSILDFNDGKCVFLSSGSEAVEFGVQVAKRLMTKPCFLYLENYFLSSYGISASRSDEEWVSLDLETYSGDVDSFLEGVPFDKIGAFIFEPGNASGTARLPPKELIKKIENKIRANNGIIVVDEVTSGIGRTGKWFGFEHFEMKPDIVVCGKGIGNGYPVSVIAMTKNIANLIEQSGFKYAQSHQNDPLGCAVIKEVIAIIKRDNLIQKSAEMGAILAQALEGLADKHRNIKEVRGTGLMYVIEFHQSKIFSLEKIHKELFDRGFIVGINTLANLLRFYPPLSIEKPMIESMINTLDMILCEDN